MMSVSFAHTQPPATSVFERGAAYLRSLIMTILFPFMTLIMGLAAIFLNIIFNSKKIDDFMILMWGQVTCWMYGVHLEVTGRENLPKGGGVILFTHSSFFDIFALYTAIPWLRFGAKIELFGIPIFGLAMKRLGTLPIARDSREEVFRVYEQAKSRFSNGQIFALAPEGKRHYGQNLGHFKSGPFVFALSAHVPLIPVVIKGAYECMRKNQFLANSDRWRRTIYLQILPPISTEAYTKESRQQLQSVAYKKMNDVWMQSSF